MNNAMDNDKPPYLRISRDDARKVPCPECRAPAGQKCYGRAHYADGTVKTRESNHMGRVRAALAAQPTTRSLTRTFRVEAAPVRAPVRNGERVSRWAGLEPATEEQTREEHCTDCSAQPGEPCWGSTRADGSRNPIASHHAPRWVAAMTRLDRVPDASQSPERANADTQPPVG